MDGQIAYLAWTGKLPNHEGVASETEAAEIGDRNIRPIGFFDNEAEANQEINDYYRKEEWKRYTYARFPPWQQCTVASGLSDAEIFAYDPA